MTGSTYYHPINWRHAQFGLTHPDVMPADIRRISFASELALFLPADSIDNVREIRDWLHDSTQTNGRYRLFGCYCIERLKYQVRSLFRGLVIVFQQVLDAVQFRFAWNGQLLTDLVERKRAA